MFHNITYLFFKLKLLQPSEGVIRYWTDTKDVEKLEYALKLGNYKTRKLAAEGLELTGKCSSVPILLHATNDKVQNVSIAALNALESLGCDDNLVISITKNALTGLKKFVIKKLNLKPTKTKNIKFIVGNALAKNHLSVLRSN